MAKKPAKPSSAVLIVAAIVFVVYPLCVAILARLLCRLIPLDWVLGVILLLLMWLNNIIVQYIDGLVKVWMKSDKDDDDSDQG